MADNPGPNMAFVDLSIDFIHWIVGLMSGALAAIGGFLARRIWINTQLISEIKQDLKDLRETVERLHAEDLVWRTEVLRRLKDIEDTVHQEH